MRYLLLTLLALLCAGALFAQAPGSGMTMGAPAGSTVMVQTPKGLFALRAGVLAKYDIKTLKLGKMISLFGPAPEAPKEGTDRAAMQKYWAEVQRRQAPAILIAKDNSLLLIIGDGFARFNQDTLEIEASADLTMPAAAADATGGNGRANDVPAYMLVDNTLILMRSKEILSVSITDGKILARNPLPAELQPLTFNFNRGGGNGGGRQPNGN